MKEKKECSNVNQQHPPPVAAGTSSTSSVSRIVRPFFFPLRPLPPPFVAAPIFLRSARRPFASALKTSFTPRDCFLSFQIVIAVQHNDRQSPHRSRALERGYNGKRGLTERAEVLKCPAPMVFAYSSASLTDTTLCFSKSLLFPAIASLISLPTTFFNSFTQPLTRTNDC